MLFTKIRVSLFSAPLRSTPLILSIIAISLLLTGCGAAENFGGSGSADSSVTSAAHKDGELLVKYKGSTSTAMRSSTLGREMVKDSRHFDSFNIEHVILKEGVTVEEGIDRFQADENVEYAEPNYKVQAFAAPNDPNYPILWGMADISAPAAWNLSVGSQEVVVAVVDTGVDYNHIDLVSNIWNNTREQYGVAGVDDDGNQIVDDTHGINTVAGSGAPLDDNGHGTHVAGTIGAVGNNGLGVAGVNWQVKIMPCKFLGSNGSGYIADAIECLQYIRRAKDDGVNLVAVNNSWGGGGYSRSLYDAINNLRDILFIAAAGNSATNNDTTIQYPAGYDLPNVISVAATTQTGALASFSSYGRRTVDVAAPGYQIFSTYPGNSYAYMSGTSMATPHVAGLAALIDSTYPALGVNGVKNLILSGGTPSSALQEKTLTGRRINAAGSLDCTDSPVFSAILAPTSVQTGVPATLSALSINCEDPVGPVTVTLSGGEKVMLVDDGSGNDMEADDGVFTGRWTPTRSAETYQFISPSGSESIGNIAPLSITTASLPAYLQGSSYSATLSATGGSAPFVWTIASGSLPQGLSLSAAGVISGVSYSTGTHSFTVQVADTLGRTATKTYSISQSATIATTTLPNARVRSYYTTALQAAGGSGPYSWSVSNGSLPGGMSLGNATGVISGTPRRSGSYRFSVTLTDNAGSRSTRSFTLRVNY